MLVSPLDPVPSQVRRLRVTNHLPMAFTDRFNGVPVEIPPGETVDVPLDMAEHFFGYHPDVKPETMLRHIMRRQGWNTKEYIQQNPETHKTLAEEYFSKLKLTPIFFKMVEEKAPVDPQEPIPAQVQDMAGYGDEPVREHWKTRQKREREEAAIVRQKREHEESARAAAEYAVEATDQL